MTRTHLTNELATKAHEEYIAENLSLVQVATRYGVGTLTMLHFWNKLNLKTRPPGHRTCKKEFVEQLIDDLRNKPPFEVGWWKVFRSVHFYLNKEQSICGYKTQRRAMCKVPGDRCPKCLMMLQLEICKDEYRIYGR